MSINVNFANEKKIYSIEDFDRWNPGAVNEIREWFRTIKTYDGKPENKFGYDEKVIGLEKTLEII